MYVCYHKCIKFFFGFKRRDSVTRILFELGLPSFSTIIHNSSVIPSLSRHRSYNLIICHLNDVRTVWHLNLLHVSFFYFFSFWICLLAYVVALSSSTLCICMLMVYAGLISYVWCDCCSVIDTYMLILHCLFLGLCSCYSFNVWSQRFRFY